jgi:hypothetical protein
MFIATLMFTGSDAQCISKPKSSHYAAKALLGKPALAPKLGLPQQPSLWQGDR